MPIENVRNHLDGLVKRDPNLRFRFDEELGVLRNLRGHLGEAPQKDSEAAAMLGRRFLEENRALFGDVDPGSMRILREIPDGGRGEGGEGMNVIFQQYHGPYRVYGGSVRFHLDEGVLDTVSNRLFPDLDQVPTEPRVTEQEAIQAAQRATKTRKEPERAPELMVYRYKGKPHLVWEVRLRGERVGERGVPPMWIVYVDAVTGKVLVAFDNVQTAGPVVGSGTGYYSGPGAVNAWSDDTTFQLRDTTRVAGGGPEIITNDEDGASPSADPDNNWDDVTAVPRHQHQGPEVDAHRYVADVVDYFQTVHGRNSFDGAGGNVISVVHLGTNYNNGYWDGSKINLGDGTGASPGDDYECTDDWLAHELTHGYTQETCGLQYLNESGALNEAFSDIFAAFITGDWLVFEDSWLKPSAPAWRNMIDPTNGGQWNVADPLTSVLAGHQPGHYTERYVGPIDNGGVHINSGIINHLFYLLTVGGTHAISGVTVTGIGQAAAEQMLYRCMAVNLVGSPTATFLDFREAMMDACLDLFPTDLEKLTQVKNAFNAVGIGPDTYVRDNTADTGLEPYGGAYLWASPDIINRTSPSADPAVDFANLGNDALWQNVEFGQDNSIYVRVQNRGPQTGDATINVYFSAATTFGTPASWIHIGTLAELAIAPGALRISGPLTFPLALIPAPGHYCMIAVLSSSLDPAPDHTLIASVSDYLSYVRNTNNISYRNMDVVNDVTGTPGKLSVKVQTLPGVRERFDLRLDVGRFVPGARILVHVPARALRGGRPRGLKLVRRTGERDVYELLAGRQLMRHLEFLGLRKPQMEFEPGFDGILVDKDFDLEVEYLLPEKLDLRPLLRGRVYTLAVRQLWKGEAVGAAGVQLRRR